ALEEASDLEPAEALHPGQDAETAALLGTPAEVLRGGAELGLRHLAVDLETDDRGVVRLDDREGRAVRVRLLAQDPAEGAIALLGSEHLVRDLGKQRALDSGRATHPALIGDDRDPAELPELSQHGGGTAQVIRHSLELQAGELAHLAEH